MDLLKGGFYDESEFSDRPSSELNATSFFPDMYFAEKLTPPDFFFAFECLALDENATGGEEILQWGE